jgi:nitrate reductase NapD
VNTAQSNSQTEYHVASFVAHINAKNLASVRQLISEIDGAEIHVESDQGKLVFTLEAESHQSIAKRMDLIKDLEGIISLAPVYHQYLTEE